MRKEVQIIGVGARKAGVSKKGRKYDFTEVAIAYADDAFQGGLKAETVAVDAAVIGDRKLVAGEVVELVMHQANFKTYVDAIL